MNMPEFLKEFILEDWRKTPPSFRFLVILGFILIGNSWLLDHWRENNELPFLYFRWDIRQLSYEIGFTLIAIAIVFIVILRLRKIEGPITSYKNKYPIENLEKDFNLVWFSGKLMLFDKKVKKYFHVYPWKTAEDLQFVSYGTRVDDRFPNPKELIVTLDNGEKLDTNKYSSGGSINTQK